MAALLDECDATYATKSGAKCDTGESLLAPERFRERVEILDRLDVYAAELDAHALHARPLDPSTIHSDVPARAQALRASLETANAQFFHELRAEIRAGAIPRAFRDAMAQPHRCAPGNHYDYLDELLAGVLNLAAPHEPTVALSPEMVFYQPTPARHIFQIIARTQLTAGDVLIDLGSGLGHVPLLAAICTQARTIGIELDPSYVASATKCAAELNLDRVTFLAQDARASDFSRATVFYLYTPFTGEILRTVLAALRHESQTRPLRLCSFGPCTHAVSAEPWLTTQDPLRPDALAIFQSIV